MVSEVDPIDAAVREILTPIAERLHEKSRKPEDLRELEKDADVLAQTHSRIVEAITLGVRTD